MTANIQLIPKIELCKHYMTSNIAEPQEISTVLVPYRIKVEDDGAIIIAWGCSLASNCHNPSCYYARIRAR